MPSTKSLINAIEILRIDKSVKLMSFKEYYEYVSEIKRKAIEGD